MGRPIALVAAALLFASIARGQEIERQWFGDVTGQRFGSTLGWVGDVNADGFVDIGIGAPRDSTAFTFAGMLRVVSGADGAVLYTFYGDANYAGLGNVGHPVGDVDLDGYDDILVSEPTYASGSTKLGRVFVFSGKDGSILRQIDGSSNLRLDGPVCGTDDVDGDGVPDFAVGSQTTKVVIYSGATSAVIRTLKPTTPHSSYFGNGILDPGDIDGDGVSDLFVIQNGCYYNSSMKSQNYIHCFSGKTGAVVWQAVDAIPCGYGVRGSALSPTVIGDIDADGVPDFAMGTTFSIASGGATGWVNCFSGKDGSVLRYVQAPMLGGKYWGSAFGRAIAATGDVDGDGVPDLAASDSALSDDLHGDVYFFSGVDGALLFHAGGTASAVAFGVTLLGGLDPDGDGRPHVLVGDELDSTNGTWAGAVSQVRLDALVLDVRPRNDPSSYALITVLGGPPGNPLALFLVAWNSAPCALLMGVDTFGPRRMSQHWWYVPSGLTGVVAELRAFAIDGSGRVVASNVDSVTFP